MQKFVTFEDQKFEVFEGDFASFNDAVTKAMDCARLKGGGTIHLPQGDFGPSPALFATHKIAISGAV